MVVDDEDASSHLQLHPLLTESSDRLYSEAAVIRLTASTVAG